MQLDNYIDVLDMRVDMVQIPGVIKIMEDWIGRRDYGNYIVISNANDVVIGKKDIKAREAVNRSSLSVPDGISLVLLGKMRGYNLKRRVYGPDLMVEFLDETYDKEYSHFFYGSTQKTLSLLIKKLSLRYPNLKIAGSYSPPFRPVTDEEDGQIVEMINRASPDVLWIGLGCPKQQLWMYEHKERLGVPVMVGVGAAFDFLAGTKIQAPRWMRDAGFEWLFRLITEPRRLSKRYIVDYSLFYTYFAKSFLAVGMQKIKGKRAKKDTE